MALERNSLIELARATAKASVNPSLTYSSYEHSTIVFTRNDSLLLGHVNQALMDSVLEIFAGFNSPFFGSSSISVGI